MFLGKKMKASEVLRAGGRGGSATTFEGSWDSSKELAELSQGLKGLALNEQA